LPLAVHPIGEKGRGFRDGRGLSITLDLTAKCCYDVAAMSRTAPGAGDDECQFATDIRRH